MGSSNWEQQTRKVSIALSVRWQSRASFIEGVQWLGGNICMYKDMLPPIPESALVGTKANAGFTCDCPSHRIRKEALCISISNLNIVLAATGKLWSSLVSKVICPFGMFENQVHRCVLDHLKGFSCAGRACLRGIQKSVRPRGRQVQMRDTAVYHLHSRNLRSYALA